MGLREHKKARTRDQLSEAACALFTERGYEATTIEDIAAAVEVSPRTFFRYYRCKEDVVVEVLRAGDLGPFLERLAARPASEPLMASLRAAAAVVVEAFEERSATVLRLARMVDAAPALRARMAELHRNSQRQLAVPIAARLGVDPVADPRPRMIAALTMAMLGVAIDEWAGDNGRADLARLFENGFDILELGVRAVTMDAVGVSPDTAPRRGGDADGGGARAPQNVTTARI